MRSHRKHKDPIDAELLRSQPRVRDVSLDELLEDLIGVSGRTLRTLRTLAVQPFAYFAAAKDPFWQNRFSPSFRIWFGLTALSLALKYFYTSDQGALTRMYVETLSTAFKSSEKLSESGIAPPTNDQISVAVQSGLAPYFLWYVPIAAGTVLLLAVVFRAFGEPLSYVTRVRYMFACLIPAAAIGLVPPVIAVFVTLPAATLWIGLVTAVLATAATLYVTAVGAMAAVKSRARRWTRAIGLFLLMTLFSGATTGALLVSSMNDAMVEMGREMGKDHRDKQSDTPANSEGDAMDDEDATGLPDS